MTARKPWSFAAGQRGHEHRVVVTENPQRDWSLQLIWWVIGETGKRRKKTETLGRGLRTAEGKVIREVERWAKGEAQSKHEALIRGDAPIVDASPAAELTIGDAAVLITDAKRGKYPTKSQHRRETEAALGFAATTWGSRRTWNSIRRADLRELGRARVQQLRAQGHVGLAGAEHTIKRVLTVAQWLRNEELIDPGACVASKDWKDELSAFWLETSDRHELPKPKRPRYSIEEALKIVAKAAGVDPRLELILWLAPNQRMAQVARIHRSNVDLEANEVLVPSRGKKRGALISLTDGERATLDRVIATGYLRELEEDYRAGRVADYPLFPSRPLIGGRLHRAGRASTAKRRRAPATPVAHRETGTVDPTTIRRWFNEARRRAKLPDVDGLGPKGVRRAFVQAAKDNRLSRDGLTALGGWSGPEMADRVYADEDQREASREARDFRARLRGEAHVLEVPHHDPSIESRENEPNDQQTTNSASDPQGAVG